MNVKWVIVNFLEKRFKFPNWWLPRSEKDELGRTLFVEESKIEVWVCLDRKKIHVRARENGKSCENNNGNGSYIVIK